MIILQAINLKKSYNGLDVFSKISCNINENERIGLVGQNGIGKTTLFNLLIDSSLADDGTVIYKKGTKIGYLEQIMTDPQKTLFYFLAEAFKDILSLREQLSELEKKISETDFSSSTYQDLIALYNEIITVYESANGYAIESFIKGIVIGLGFSEVDLSRKLESFSGGEKARLSLAKLLIATPDLLFLDEPTNHLDINGIEWLETYLKNYNGTVFVISHDKQFMDNVVTQIYELENNHLQQYKGNYSYYEKEKVARKKSYEKALAKQKKEIAKTKEFIEKYKAGVKSKQARGRQKQLEKILPLEEIKHKKVFSISTDSSLEQSGNIVLSIENLTKNFSKKNIFESLSFELYRGEKVSLIGKNGSGKSTLLKCILNIEKPDSGIIKLGSNVSIGYFDQNHSNLNLSRTVYEEVLYNSNLNKEEIRNLLASFLFFEDSLEKYVHSLSGGEKTRLSFLLLTLNKPNFLILDEPTNHLDIDSQDALINYLNNYSGTLLVVSHDRNFLDVITEKTLVLDDGKITLYYGNYSYYKEKLMENIANTEKIKTKKVNTKQHKNNLSKSKLIYSIEICEETITTIEVKIEEIKQKLLTTSPKNYNDLNQYSTLLYEMENELAQEYEKWSNLNHQLEEIK